MKKELLAVLGTLSNGVKKIAELSEVEKAAIKQASLLSPEETNQRMIIARDVSTKLAAFNLFPPDLIESNAVAIASDHNNSLTMLSELTSTLKQASAPVPASSLGTASKPAATAQPQRPRHRC